MRIGNNLIQISQTWSQIKSRVQTYCQPLFYEDIGDLRTIFVVDNPIIYVCTLGLLSDSDAAEVADFNSNWAALSNKSTRPTSSRAVPIIQTDLRSGEKTQIISQNFCDKTTWYATSTRYSSINMVDSGDGLKWLLPDGYQTVIDVTHGKILHERRLRPTYVTKVYVDGYLATEVNPDTNIGDYTLDARLCVVTFNDSQAGKSVTIDYSKVNNSKWYVSPSDGKILRLVSAELQFSTDAKMNDSFVFQARADVAKFPPLAPYCTTNGGPYPPGTKLAIGDPVCYQTVFDLICEANLAYPVIPKWVGENAGWRDLKSDIMIFSWDYGEQASVDVRSDWGMDLEISLENHIECGGHAAVVTFYCLSEDV